jgi:hypothetical protein
VTAAEWTALAGVIAGGLINLGGYLVAYGVLRGTVGALSLRVTALETDVKTLDDMKLTVARVETRLEAVVEQLRDLNASVRWMREPAPPYEPRPVRTKD